MNRLVLAMAPLMLAATPAAAQDAHSGHVMPPATHPAPAPAPAPRPRPPVARPTPAPATVNPHAGHDMSTMAPAAVDPNTGHDMSGMAMSPADPHADHDMGGMETPPDVPTSADNPGRPPEAPVPAVALSGPAHAADLYFDPTELAAAREQLRVENGAIRTTAVFVDRLEATFADGEDAYLWDVQGWTGGDVNRFWWKSEGAGRFSGALEDAEIQALYSRAVTPFWNVQTGVRQDVRPNGEDTTHMVLGLQGLAPHWWEIDAAAFLSTGGDLTARVEAEYDQRLTQRLILQPRFEIDLAAGDIPELGIGAGLGTIEAGLRLRYEIRKELAPYAGIEWTRRLGATADFARTRGEDVDAVRAVVGLKAWF